MELTVASDVGRKQLTSLILAAWEPGCARARNADSARRFGI